jgi:hypothetical protein
MDEKLAKDEEIPLPWREAAKHLTKAPVTTNVPLITVPIRILLGGEGQPGRRMLLVEDKPYLLQDVPLSNMHLVACFKGELLIIRRAKDEDLIAGSIAPEPELLCLGDILIAPTELQDLWLNRETIIHLPEQVRSGTLLRRGKAISVRVEFG